jgi:hypothetical protein
MNHLAPPSLRMNLNMAETGMHQNRRLHKDRVGASRLGQAQAKQSQQSDGFEKRRLVRVTHYKSPMKKVGV